MSNINFLDLQTIQDQPFSNQPYYLDFNYYIRGIHQVMKNIYSAKNLDYDKYDHYFGK
jgi:hypothetical protein